jgi:hypothetical protein
MAAMRKEGMVMNGRLSAWLAVVVAFALLTGCQATPEQPVVINKNTEQLIDAAIRNEEKLTLAQMLKAPDRLVLSTEDGSGTVRVNADAAVVVPDAKGVSTTRIRKRSFTQAEADSVLYFFVGDRDFNTRYEAGYDEMTELLLQFKANLAQETDADKRAQLEQSIAKFESAGITVPDEPEAVLPASRMFEPRKEGGECISGYLRDGEGKCFLSIVNSIEDNENTVLYTREQKGYAVCQGTYWYAQQFECVDKIGLDPETVSATPLSLTAEEAKATAADTLIALGISDMTLAVCEEVWGGTTLKGGLEAMQGRHAYTLKYVRAVGGIPVTYTEASPDGDYVENENTPDERVIAGWPYEEVHFVIDDTGIAEFVWQSPYELVETVTTHSAVKPFDEISSVFSKMLLIKHAWSDRKMDLTFNISRAQLGLMRIMEKDKPDTALLIPVWDFFGDVVHENADAGGEKQSFTTSDAYTSWLTINAIDGSVIDRSLGY